MEAKQPKTIEQLIDILKKRGLYIDNYKTAEKFLSRTNYYTLSGYLYPFQGTDGNFTENITFDKVCRIYECDKRFKNIILFALDEIEQTLKTKISYYLAHKIGGTGYLDEKYFKNKDEYKIFRGNLEKIIKDNEKLPFVKHHINKYNNVFPIWAAIDLFTMGMLKYFCCNLNTIYQKEIAKEFGLSVNIFLNWLSCIVYLRNLAAHYRRLYNFTIAKTPVKDKKDKNVQIPSYKVYDIIYIMKTFFYCDKNSWNNFIISTLEQIFSEYNDAISISAYGFNDNWLHNLKIE